MSNLLDIFRTKKKVEDEVFPKDSLKGLILDENGLEKMIWLSAVKQFNSNEKGTLIEFFINNEKKPTIRGLSINGASVEIKITPEIKAALNSKDEIRIKRSQVDFKQNGLRVYNGQYEFKDIHKINEIGSYTTNIYRMQTPVVRNKEELVFIPKPKVISKPIESKPFILENKPLKKIQELQGLSQKLNYTNSLFNQFFEVFLDKSKTVQVDDKEKAWNYINTYEVANKKIKSNYLEYIQDNNHLNTIKKIKKINQLRTVDGKVIPLKSTYIIQSLEQTLMQDDDFIFERWNSKAIDEEKVKEYIKNRRSVYDINSKKRTYTNDEIINGSENKDVDEKFYDNVNESSKEKMQEEDSQNAKGTTNKFKHTMSNSTFYKYAS